MSEQNRENTISDNQDSKSFHDQMDELRGILEQNLRYTKTIHEFTPKDAIKRDEDFNKHLKEIADYTKASYAVLEKVDKWIFWQKIFFILKIFFIAIPIVLGIIYLPPLLESVLQPYQELLNSINSIKE